MNSHEGTSSAETINSIIDRLERAKQWFSKLGVQVTGARSKEALKAVDEFEKRVRPLLFSSKTLQPIIEIFGDKDYFPKDSIIVDYVNETHRASVKKLSSRRLTAERAAQVVLWNDGVEKLKGYVATIRKPKRVNVFRMEIDQIRQEFSNESEYPDIKSIKDAVKDVVKAGDVRSYRKRESLIEKIITLVEASRSSRAFQDRRE